MNNLRYIKCLHGKSGASSDKKGRMTDVTSGHQRNGNRDIGLETIKKSRVSGHASG
jgi:hypothetical protein